MKTLENIKQQLKSVSSPERAKINAQFFKTSKGQYGEGDVFIGVTVPQQRIIVKNNLNASFNDIQNLISSKIHEHRLTGLLILVEKYNLAKKSNNSAEMKKIFEFYLKNSKSVNNWDLVDCSAPYIVGDYLLSKDRDILYKLAKSNNLWEKRIAIIATFTFIKNNEFKDTLKISEILMKDEHDLIHKAVGWMLRELGKKDQKTEEDFLKKHYKRMPRTMLRYAIERFDKGKRAVYMKKVSS